MIIRGNTVSTNMPRADYAQTDEAKASFIRNKPDAAISRAQQTADAALPRSGGEMTGSIAMGGNHISGLGEPTQNTDAATKQYVDSKRLVCSAVLAAGSWAERQQTVAVEGVTKGNDILVTPAPASYVAYGEAVVYCSSQSEGILTFTCDEVPTADLTVNVLIMN